MGRKVIFLDVDGVLNTRTTVKMAPNGDMGVESDLISILADAVKETGAELVLSSDWKNDWDKEEDEKSAMFKYLESQLAKCGLTIVDRTEDDSDGSDRDSGRGAGIKKYLDEHPDVENFVILDDCEFKDFITLGFKDDGKFIRTRAKYGITREDKNMIVDVLGKKV